MGNAAGSPPSRRRFGVLLVLLGLTMSAPLALGVSEARAVAVGAAPTWPIADATAGPPPIPGLPAASATPPPADQIGDPVTPAASCGDWYRQTSYGDRWPAGSTWWEYRCTFGETHYYNPCYGNGGAGACPGFCPECWWETKDWVDYIVWDGSNAVFYGETYTHSIVSEGGLFPDSSATWWWDVATSRWYDITPYLLSVSKQGTGSGAVSSSPSGIACGSTCRASFDFGTTVTLTAAADASSTFTGWSGACSGTGTCEVTMNQERAVTSTFSATAFTLTVSKAGTGSGDVTSSPAGIACDATCQASFPAGTSVTLTATPAASSIFTGWSGACSSSAICHVTMDQAKFVTATFAPITFRPDALLGSAANGLWTGDGVYSMAGTDETLSLIAARGTTATFYVAAQNDGNVADALSVRGPGSVAGLSVRYFDGASDVTASVVQGSYSTGQLAASAARVLRVTVAIAHSVRRGTVSSWLVQVGSHGLADAVDATVTVT